MANNTVPNITVVTILASIPYSAPFSILVSSIRKGKIPFEISSSMNTPIALGDLSDEEFDEAMDKAARSYANGLCTDIADFKIELNK